MPECPNCGDDVQGGMKFCPNCGQDLSVVVPQDQRIPTEDVPVPPPPSGSKGGSGSNRRLLINIGVVVLIILGLLIAIPAYLLGGTGLSRDYQTSQTSSADVVQAFKDNGLEVGIPYPVDEDPDWTSNLVPKTYVEGTHFDASSENAGGQVLTFENRRDLEVMKRYWEDFNDRGGFFYSHVYDKDNAILHLTAKCQRLRPTSTTRFSRGKWEANAGKAITKLTVAEGSTLPIQASNHSSIATGRGLPAPALFMSLSYRELGMPEA
jgi:hypothetical protein